jgi:HEAT repeat protein
MTKRATRTEETLARLAAARRGDSAMSQHEVRAALLHERSVVVARAAEVAAELELEQLGSELPAAFERLTSAEDDRELMAADTVLRATAKLGAHAYDMYLAALGMRRMVKVMDSYVDVAAPLRAHAAMALVETGFATALEEVAPLLVDTESSVQIAAAEAIGVLGGPGAAAVLRLRLGASDGPAEVLGACLAGLLRVDAERYLPFVAARLQSDDVRLVELAAIALGETRSAPAFTVLRDAMATAPRRAVANVLLGIALLRRDEATAYLLEAVEGATPAVASAALTALGLHKHDDAIASRVRSAVDRRGEARLRDAWHATFAV